MHVDNLVKNNISFIRPTHAQAQINLRRRNTIDDKGYSNRQRKPRVLATVVNQKYVFAIKNRSRRKSLKTHKQRYHC